jgi:antitoxin PrlF
VIAQAKLTSKGQLTIPKVIRERLDLKPGDKIIFLIRDDRIELEVVGGDILNWYGSLQVDDRQDWDHIRGRVRQKIVDEVLREGATD